jgi:hypothetical protein
MMSFVALSLAMASTVAAQRSMTVGAIFGYFSSRSSRLHHRTGLQRMPLYRLVNIFFWFSIIILPTLSQACGMRPRI